MTNIKQAYTPRKIVDSIDEFNLAVIYLVISSDIEIYYIIHRVYISTYIISKKITIF